MTRSAWLTLVGIFILSAAGSPVLAQTGRGHGAGKPQASSHPSGKPADTPKGSATGNPHAAATTVTATTPTTKPNPNLQQRLQVLLPGINVTDAAKGFKNWGQFVAAAHVSHNLNIPFADLKAKMTGSTPMSLGQAIHALKPAGTATDSDVKREVKKAETEADEDFRVARDDHDR
jgi:hypothetical protein